MRKTKEQKAITLIALIITIVVLLILAAVAINAITEYNIIENANSAAQKYGNQAGIEDETLGGYSSEIDKYLGGVAGENGSGSDGGEIISKETDYSKYYADTDNDGDIDGIIFADLVVSKSGEWGTNGKGTYSYDAKTTLNKYTIRDVTTEEQGLFKGAIDKVIAPTGEQKEENDRFYVMALADVSPGTRYCWYAAAYGQMSDYETATSEEFGTGKVNTDTIIEKWNDELYGLKNTGGLVDLWGVIQEEVKKEWFVPSRAEWAAFADIFNIDSKNRSEYGFTGSYWSSSQYNTKYAWVMGINGDRVFDAEVSQFGRNFVRLCTKF